MEKWRSSLRGVGKQRISRKSRKWISRLIFDELPENMICFHAGTKIENGQVITSGGRVFGLTAWANDIESAIDNVYSNIKNVSFDGMQYRKDIAHRALEGSK